MCFPHSTQYFILNQVQLLHSDREKGRPFYSSITFNKCFAEVILHSRFAYANLTKLLISKYIPWKKK